jgi:hypothetical protein
MSRRWRRIVIGFGITVAVLSTYAWFFGFNTMMMLESRWVGRKSPVVWLTPVPLQDTSISTAQGQTLRYFNHEFSVPWGDLDSSLTKISKNRVVLRFHSGKTLMFSSSPPREWVKTLSEQTNPESLRRLYGDEPMQSDYALVRIIAESTPGKITLRSPRNEAVGNSMLLVVKAIAAPEESGIYSLQTKDFKGFQWGDPASKPRHVVADLFADDGGLEFIFTGPGKGQPLGITQAEINCVLQSAHKIP